MNRQEKEERIESWHDLFGRVEGAVFTGVSGMTVAQSTDLRRRFNEAQVSYRVVKNSLARRAIKGIPMEIATDLIDGPTAIAWSAEDPTVAARVAAEFAKNLSKFEIRGGFADGRRLDVEGVKALASMPSFEELRAQILGLVNGVAAKLLAQVKAPGQQLAGVLQARKEDLEKEAA